VAVLKRCSSICWVANIICRWHRQQKSLVEYATYLTSAADDVDNGLQHALSYRDKTGLVVANLHWLAQPCDLRLDAGSNGLSIICSLTFALTAVMTCALRSEPMVVRLTTHRERFITFNDSCWARCRSVSNATSPVCCPWMLHLYTVHKTVSTNKGCIFLSGARDQNSIHRLCHWLIQGNIRVAVCQTGLQL